jgi:hypothetical protein
MLVLFIVEIFLHLVVSKIMYEKAISVKHVFDFHFFGCLCQK